MDLPETDSKLINELRIVLSSFAVPNSSTLLQANKGLHELSQHSSFLPSLFTILSNDEEPQLRHTAAIVFRRKATRLWNSFDIHIQLEIRQAVLQRLSHEKEKYVQHAVMEIIGAIAKQEFFSDRNWPELMVFVEKNLRNGDLKQKECAAELLKIVCDSCAEHFEGQYDALLILIDEVLKSNISTNASFFCVEAFNFLIPFLGDDQACYVRPLVPQCVQVIKMLLDNDCESQASELIELFDNLIETEVSFIAPYVKDVVMFLLQIARDGNKDDYIRTRVLSVLQGIICLKKKAIIKNKLIGTILEVICPIIVSSIDEINQNEEGSFIGENTDVQTPFTSSLRVIDDMALHFPPVQLYKKLMPFLEVCMSSDEEKFKIGLLLTLACLVEGTSEYIKAKHMRQFLEVICRGALDSRVGVRNAALFALGQFSEHLQPDITEFAPEIMPMLFEILEQIQREKRDTGLRKAYYALGNFVESLDARVLCYLDKIMQHLLNTLQSTTSVHVKELVINAIGAVSNSAKDHLLKYLPAVLEQIQACLSSINGKDDSGEQCIVHTQALDTLSILVRNLGKLHPQLAEDSMKLGMQLVENPDADPDLRRSAYILFAAVASVVGESMQPFLGSIVKCIINSIQSTEGIIPHYNSKESGVDFSFLDDSSTDVDSVNDENESEIEGFSVENSYMDEKVDAVNAVGDFAKHCGKSFEPYLDICVEEVSKQQDYPHADIQKAAVTAYGQLVIASHKLNHPLPGDIKRGVFPNLSTVISHGSDRLVVMAAIMTSKEIIEACGLEVLANKQDDLEGLMNSLLRVFQQRSACQDDEIDDDDDQQEYGTVRCIEAYVRSVIRQSWFRDCRQLKAEYDEMLIEYCGEVLTVLAAKLKEEFLPYFLAFLPAFLKKLVSSVDLLEKQKPSSTTSEKSFSAGTIAEIVEALGPCCPDEMLSSVVPRFIKLSRDSEVEVRNNVIFGLGVLLQNGDSAATSYYPLVLGCLSQALTRETSRRVVDNILSALARMISANKELIPLTQVIPVFLSHLPIQEDHDEDAAVYSCLATLLRDTEIVSDLESVAKIINVFATVLSDKKVKKDIRISIENELRFVKSSNQHPIDEIISSDFLNTNSKELVKTLWMT